MNTNTLRNRIKYFPSSKKKLVQSNAVKISRREPGWVDTSDLDSNQISPDFFEFEKELADFKASNANVGDSNSNKE
jgi:hypothetical protein